MASHPIVQVSRGSFNESYKESITTTNSRGSDEHSFYNVVLVKPHGDSLPNTTPARAMLERRNSSSSDGSKPSSDPLSLLHSNPSNGSSGFTSTLATGGSRLSLWSTNYRVGLIETGVDDENRGVAVAHAGCGAVP
ncbi:hypothetical protein OBBRIDRAFT_890054 [Obba rivulosa]|uniref:Uncharacterized protein n=1 Tax=Obba rivulosa TaxID=1052685 RepID=A0A8E2APM2_9APHY|nr:hypothetical protein OBBRIDRAFT_890054 [Obba rivulosa]